MSSNYIIWNLLEFGRWLVKQFFGRSDDFESKCGILHVLLIYVHSMLSFWPFFYKYPHFLSFCSFWNPSSSPSSLFFLTFVLGGYDVMGSLLAFHTKGQHKPSCYIMWLVWMVKRWLPLHIVFDIGLFWIV